MGGLLIVGALLTSTLLWARLDNPFIWIILFVTMSFAAIGFADDLRKGVKTNDRGGIWRGSLVTRLFDCWDRCIFCDFGTP